MPLSLPYFKFNVSDWILSEKIEAMSGPQVGAYIMLLAHCWASGNCTLPNEPSTLKSKARWQGNDEDFQLVLDCFCPSRGGRLTNKRLYREWEEAMDKTDERRQSGLKGATKRWAPKQARTIPTHLSNGHTVVKKGKRPISEDDKPTDKHRELATQLKIDMGPEWAKFRNYCLANDRRFANFEAAFRNWIVRASEMKGERRVL